jgi:hypothetical protein
LSYLRLLFLTSSFFVFAVAQAAVDEKAYEKLKKTCINESVLSACQDVLLRAEKLQRDADVPPILEAMCRGGVAEMCTRRGQMAVKIKDDATAAKWLNLGCSLGGRDSKSCKAKADFRKLLEDDSISAPQPMPSPSSSPSARCKEGSGTRCSKN